MKGHNFMPMLLAGNLKKPELYIAFNHYILWIVASKGHSFIMIFVLCTQFLCGNALFYKLNNLITDVGKLRTNE